MPLMDLFFDQVFVDFLQLRAKLLEPPGSSLDPSFLLYKFFVDYFMKPKFDAARDRLLNDFNSSTVPWGPANFSPEPAMPRQMRYWKMQWLEEKEKKAKSEAVQDSAQPREGESEWAKLNRLMSYHPDPWRYWYWEWLDEQEKEKEKCAAEGKVYVDPVKPLPEIEPPRGEFYFKTKDTLGQRYLYTRPTHPIYKRARLMYLRKHPDENCLRHYLTPSELKQTRGLEPGPLSQMKKVSREKIEFFKRMLESWRQNPDDLVSSQSLKEQQVAAAIVEDMSLAQEEEEEVTLEGQNVEEKVDKEWPSIPGDNVENEDDVKLQEEADDQWPSSQQEEYIEEDDVKNDLDEHDDWPSVQEKEYAEEELVRATQDEQTREEEDVERPFIVHEENAQEFVQTPLVQEAENFEEVDVEKRKGKRWWRRPTLVLNKSLLLSALLILALFCGLCIYSSSSVTYQNDGLALSLKIRMYLPHPSWFRVGRLITRVASSSVHTFIHSSWPPFRFMYVADCNCDGRLTPT